MRGFEPNPDALPVHGPRLTHGFGPAYSLFPLYDPATISLAMLGMSAVSTVGGFIQGNKAQKQNDKIAGEQSANFAQARDMALQFASSIRREEYDRLANVDINRAMEGVQEIMASRGLGLGSSAMASTMAGAAGEIKGQYGRAYLQDKQAATSQAINTTMGVASAPRLGYNDNPWGQLGSGLNSLGDWAANNRAGLGVDPVTGLRYGQGQQSIAKPDPNFIGPRYP